MQKILLILLLINSVLRASEDPKKTPSQFVMDHLLKSKIVVTWWQESEDWQNAITKPGVSLETKGPGTAFEISNNGENVTINFRIDAKIAANSGLFKQITTGMGLTELSPDDPKTTGAYTFKKSCLSTELYFSGVSTFTLDEFMTSIRK